MTVVPTYILSTERLRIRLATVDDAYFFLALWTNPAVMVNVGFPRGLNITIDEIHNRLEKQTLSPFGNDLLVEIKADRRLIGECRMYLPDLDGISETDIKLLPEFWGKGYGTEIKQAIVNYLFTHSECSIVQATPNVNNLASIKMQEAVGGICVSEAVSEVPSASEHLQMPVHHYVYHVYRESWEFTSTIKST